MIKTAKEWHLEFERCSDANGCVSTDDELRIVSAIQKNAIDELVFMIACVPDGDYYIKKTVRDAASVLKRDL